MANADHDERMRVSDNDLDFFSVLLFTRGCSVKNVRNMIVTNPVTYINNNV